MKLSSINTEQKLYVIECAGGYSCYGFDVLDKKARAVADWLKRGYGFTVENFPPPGTLKHFKLCNIIMRKGAEYAKSSGSRCDAGLVPKLIGLEGKRIECEYFGEKVRFWVGKSTGWLPYHLQIKTRRSSGGGALFADELKNIKVIDGGPR